MYRFFFFDVFFFSCREYAFRPRSLCLEPRSSLIDLERGRPARANYTTADFDLRCDPSRFPKGTLPDYCNDRAMTIFQGGCVLSVSKV